MTSTHDGAAPDLTTPQGRAALRAQFPTLNREVRGHRVVYLDSGATSLRSQGVIDAETHFYVHTNASVHRGAHQMAEEATDAYEAGRAAVARFISANDDEIVFTRSATESLNLLAYGIQNATFDAAKGIKVDPRLVLGPGDEILISELEHHSNIVPWQMVARHTGATLKWMGITEDGRLDMATLDRLTERTKIVSISHASNVTGAITPVAQIVDAARAVGALVFLDASQSAPHFPVNARELGVDALTFSAHKMLGPTGIGVLWARPELLDALPPFQTGGSMVEIVTMEETTFASAPTKFEAGSQATAQVAAWTPGIELLEKLGMENIAAYEEALTRYLLDGITRIPGVRVLGPTTPDQRVGAVSFVLDGVHPHDLSQVLDDKGIEIRVGHHCAQPVHRHFGVPASARATLSVYNTIEDIDRFLEALASVQEFFGVTHG